MKDYRFGPYLLCNEHMLYRDKRLLSVPPKELAVLNLLLQHAGKLVTKHDIIRRVWHSDNVTDESLTRCIYNLRKILKESSKLRYIETIYGKGYRFICPIVHSPGNSDDGDGLDGNVIALYPFKGEEETLLSTLNAIPDLSTMLAQKGFVMMSSNLTSMLSEDDHGYAFLREAGAHYFLSGKRQCFEEKMLLCVELVYSNTLQTAAKQHFIISRDPVKNALALRHLLDQMLDVVRQEKNKQFAQTIKSVAGNELMLRSASVPPPLFNINHDAHRTHTSICDDRFDAPTLYDLVGCYLALSALNVIEQVKATEIILKIIEKIIITDPGSEQAVLLRTVFCPEMADSRASELQIALILSPGTAKIYYFYACHLVVEGEIHRAKSHLDMAIALKPDYFSAHILLVIVRFLLEEHDAALDYAISLKYRESSCDIILDALLVILFHKREKYHECEQALSAIRHHRYHCELVDTIYVWLNRCRAHARPFQRVIQVSEGEGKEVKQEIQAQS